MITHPSDVLPTASETPPRPGRVLAPPAAVARYEVEVEVAHLANPLLAVSRLLASEAGAFAHVGGDERHLTVEVALPAPDARADVAAWVRWAVHNAGIRGRIAEVG